MKGRYLKSDSFDATYNLALEEYLLSIAGEEPVLYLWQNRDAVIIGRNQNAYTECNLEYARENGVQLVRRLTGGGAVYHDLGNINFSFVVPRKSYDLKASMQLVSKALKRLDIEVEINGRNDLCLEGRKISGNAYYLGQKVALHHGTILYRLNLERMETLLYVSKEKLAKRGIQSVRSRVTDIVSHYSDITISEIYSALKDEFLEYHNLSTLDEIGSVDNTKLLEKYRSDLWNLDRIRDYERKEKRSSCLGEICLSYLYEGDKLKSVEISSDALDADQIDELRQKLNQEIAEYGQIVNDPF